MNLWIAKFLLFMHCMMSVQTQDPPVSPSVQEKLKQLADIQREIFGIKSKTKEDDSVAMDSSINIFSLLADESESMSPEQLPYLFEGDIILSDELADEILKNAQAQLNNKTSISRTKRSVTNNLSLRWTNFPIPFYINLDTGVNEQAILNGINRWQQDTCLTFARANVYPNTTNALEFIKGSGCYSFIGKSGNRPQQVSIGTGCTSLGTVTHEIGHALGLYHEQSRYDRNDYVEIMVQNIQSSYLGQFSRQGANMMVDYGVGYDYGSVMHYDQSSFNKRGQKTIETLDKNYQNCAACRCPDGLGGTFCDHVQPSVDDCGQTSFTTTNDFQVVKLSGNKTCYFLVKAPDENVIFFELGNLTFTTHNPCLTEYLEVKYRTNFVQAGARYCQHYPDNSLSESNTMIFIYKGSATSAVNLRFRTGPYISSIGPFSTEGLNSSTSSYDYYDQYQEKSVQTICSSWSPCSASCGACGTTTRFCNGVQETAPCNVLPCNNNYCCLPAYNSRNLCVFAPSQPINNMYPDYEYYNY